MATPPTFVAEYESAWDPGAATRSVSVTVAAGDYLVVIGATEDGAYTQGTPSGGGLTYTLQQSVQVANYCSVRAWTAPCATSQTFTLSVALSPGSADNGINVLRFSGSSGIGASSVTNVASGAPSLALTTSDNSAIVVINADWTASTATRTWRTINGITPSAGNGLEVSYFSNASNYGIYGAYWSDSGTAGSKTTGLSAPTGQKYSIIAVEVLGTTGGGPTPIALAEGGTATDSLTVTAAVPLADAASESGALSATVVTALAETGSGADSPGVAAEIPLADGGSSAEALAVPSQTIPLADGGSSSQALTASVAAPLADAATQSEAISAVVSLALADAGAEADALDNGLGTSKNLADAGAGSESLATAVTVPLAESGVGAESLAAGAVIPLADGASAADALAVPSRTVSLADAATAAEALGAGAAVPLADAGTASDALDNGLGTNKPLTESGAGGDALTVTVLLAFGDAGAGVTTVATGAVVSLADSGSAAEAAAASALVPLTDAASAAESLTASVLLALADTGTAADTGVGQDVAFVSKSLGDAGGGSDILAFVPSLVTGRPGVTGDPLGRRATGDPLTAEVTGVY